MYFRTLFIGREHINKRVILDRTVKSNKSNIRLSQVVLLRNFGRLNTIAVFPTGLCETMGGGPRSFAHVEMEFTAFTVTEPLLRH